MTMSCKGLTQSINISVQLQLVTFITSKVSIIRSGQNVRPDLGPNCLQRVISK